MYQNMLHIDKLDDIVNEYNIKPVDVKDTTDIDSSKDVNDKDPKLKVGDHVRISKCKNILFYICRWNCVFNIF